MSDVAQILTEHFPERDFSASKDLIAEGLLDSYDVIILVSEIEKTLDIKIPGADITPENFKTLASIDALINVQRIQAR